MSFPKQVLTALLSVCAVGSYPLYAYGNAAVIQAAIVGAVLATVNVLFGYLAIERTFNKSTAIFLRVVLGGMGIRMFVLAALFVLLIKIFGFDVLALVCSTGIFYVLYLTLEVLYINKKVSLRQQ